MIADFHNDVLTSLDREELLADYQKSGNDIVCAFFKGEKTIDEALAVCGRFNRTKSKNLYLAFEDISYSDDEETIYSILSLKPVCVSLCWNHENAFAGGALSGGSLTPLGKKVVGMVNESGTALDLAHLNEKSFFAALDAAKIPVCTHACFSSVNAHPRNLTDEELCALESRGGLVGLAFYRPFLTKSERADVNDVLRHVDWFCSRYSYKNLCVGSDLNGCEDLAEGFFGYGFEGVLREGLDKLGYARAAVDAILYDNLHRFLMKR